MPIDIVYANANDYEVSGTNASWATARAGSGLVASTGGTVLAPRSSLSGNYEVAQAIIRFNASAVTGTVTAFSVVLTCQSVNAGGDTIEIRERTSTGTGTGNFVAGASLGGLTLIDAQSVTGAGAVTFTNNALNPAGSSNYGILVFAQRQRTNVAPTAATVVFFHASEATGTTNDPYLSITTVTSVSLTVDNASHGHTANSPTLAAKSTLAANGATHAHAVTSPSLSFIPGVAPDNAIHVHVATSPVLVPHAVLAVNDNHHGHIATSPTLAFNTVLAINSASHGHSCSSSTLDMSGWPFTRDAAPTDWNAAADTDDSWTTTRDPAPGSWAA